MKRFSTKIVLGLIAIFVATLFGFPESELLAFQPEPATVAETTKETPAYMTLDSEVQDMETKGKLILTGVVGLALLSLLGIAFGYLRLNHATRGFYSRRLQLGATVVAAIVALICYGLYTTFSA